MGVKKQYPKAGPDKPDMRGYVPVSTLWPSSIAYNAHMLSAERRRPLHLTVLTVLVAATALLTGGARAQDAPLPADDPVWEVLRPLLVRGGAPQWNWTQAPLTEGDARQLMEGLSGSLPRLASHMLPTADRHSANWGIRVRAEGRLTAQDGFDPLRSGADQDANLYQLVQYESYARWGRWMAGFGWRHDGFYERDVDALDAALRWQIRPENTYIRYEGSIVGLTFGRLVQHWGPPGLEGLMLSDNPRPMDHIALRLGSGRLVLHSSLNELDSITTDGRFTGTAGDDSVAVGAERRFLAAHRLDIRVHPEWSISLMHSTLYSGGTAGFSLKFANPFNVGLFSIDNRPKNEENNGLLGLEVRHSTPTRAASLQFMLDDVDVLNLSEPISFGVAAFAETQVSPKLSVGGRGLAVAARTYKTFQPEGRYVYLLRSIGAQQADAIDWQGWIAHVTATDAYMVHTRLGVEARWQGEHDLLADFPGDSEPSILTGSTRRTVRPFARLFAWHASGLFARADVGPARSGGETDVRGSLAIGFRVHASGRLEP